MNILLTISLTSKYLPFDKKRAEMKQSLYGYMFFQNKIYRIYLLLILANILCFYFEIRKRILFFFLFNIEFNGLTLQKVFLSLKLITTQQQQQKIFISN